MARGGKGWATVLVAGWLVAGAGVRAAEPQALRIGLVGPFSGPSAAFGLPMHNGVALAVAEVNAAGGYLGRPLELVIRDDMGRPEVGRQRAEELVAEKVLATLGFCNTGVAQAALEVFQHEQVPLIIPCATGPGLTTRYPGAASYVFRTAPPDGLQAAFVVDHIVRRGWTRVALLADTTAYGEAGVQDVTAALARHHLQPVHVARFSPGTQDLGAELKAAREAGANVVFSHTVGPENAVVAQGRQALGWAVPQVGNWPLSFPFFLSGGTAVEGALMAQSFIAESDTERRAAFLAAYARAQGMRRMDVPMAAAQGYDAVYLLLQGLFGVRSGTPDGPALKAALENLGRSHHGVVATYRRPFSAENKEAITPDMLVMGQVVDGRIVRADAERPRRRPSIPRPR